MSYMNKLYNCIFTNYMSLGRAHVFMSLGRAHVLMLLGLAQESMLLGPNVIGPK
ncbi:hypothetical protein HanPSC8_Chr05g0214521 [Helianthus annuus]|nr:hypothetical protein HanPSC8_Chr05g0214521 [Helianthus annuus]